MRSRAALTQSTPQHCFPGTHRVLAAEPWHLLVNALVDVAFLLEQVLQLVALLLEVLHLQFQALHFTLVTLPLRPLVALQCSAAKSRRERQPGATLKRKDKETLRGRRTWRLSASHRRSSPHLLGHRFSLSSLEWAFGEARVTYDTVATSQTASCQCFLPQKNLLLDDSTEKLSDNFYHFGCGQTWQDNLDCVCCSVLLSNLLRSNQLVQSIYSNCWVTK